MVKARLTEILRREHKKLEQSGAKLLREYAGDGGKAKQDLDLTFYMICRVLAQSTDARMLSRDLQKQITTYMRENGIQVIADWNPVDFFSKEWTEGHLDPEYTEIINRDKQRVWRMWLAEQYADDVRQFFGNDIGEPTLHNEGRTVSEDSALTALARHRLFWDPPEKMEEVVRLLLDKRQLIFYGPPGTGKTFVARTLAKHLMGGEEATLLQFHPSYSYEDFFEGYRPVPCKNGGIPQFELIPGPLKQLAKNAKMNLDKKFVLVIDEINRGNLAKIFGELYFLLEYRNEQIMLQYGGQPFSLPENLLIIGTMNTADRSISHIDAALRRRFHFFPLFPNEEPIKGLLERYLASGHKHKRLDCAQVVALANKKLGCRDSSIGHSYLMPKDPDNLNESWVQLIWKYSIMPLIEDHFIDQPNQVKEFELDRLRSELREGPAQEPA